MGAQPTPGPWHVGGKETAPIIYDQAGNAISDARVFHGKWGVDQALANAKLISAAPALADACSLAASVFDRYAQNHRAKGTADGEGKARTNEAAAAVMRLALSRAGIEA